MDKRLLILCDELPGDYEHYSIKDLNYLRSTMYDTRDYPDQLFVSWDVIVPEDRWFIEMCKHYASSYESIPRDFFLKKRGQINKKNGGIKGSIQEDSYYVSLTRNIINVELARNNGEDYQALAMELAVQYPMQATQHFIENFSNMLNNNDVARILIANKCDTNPELVEYRMALLDAWKNQNQFLKDHKSDASIVGVMEYEDFGEVYKKSSDEVMKIYSLPILPKSNYNV